MDKIRFMNMCIVEFGKKLGMSAYWSYQYLKEYKGLDFCYEAEHLLSLDDTLSDLQTVCKRNGGTL